MVPKGGATATPIARGEGLGECSDSHRRGRAGSLMNRRVAASVLARGWVRLAHGRGEELVLQIADRITHRLLHFEVGLASQPGHD